jgi:hypothetical protein
LYWVRKDQTPYDALKEVAPMSTITTLVALGHLVPEGFGVSGIQGGQPEQCGDRWTSSNPYRATGARVDAALVELPKHVAALMNRPTTDVPTTGVPQSAMERRT